MPMIHQGRMESYQWQEPRSLVDSSGGEHEDGGFDRALVTRVRQRWEEDRLHKREPERQNDKRDLKYIEWKLIGSLEAGKKMIGLEQDCQTQDFNPTQWKS